MSGPTSAIGRAAYAAEKRELRDDLLSRYQTAAALDSRTHEGRKAWGLYVALRALGVDPHTAHEGATAYDEAIGQLVGGLDIVDVGIGPFDGTDRDPLPIRLCIADGADDTTANAYLTIDEACELVELLTQAIATVERRWAGDPP